ncbi:hypothetical protein [Mycolicibacterium arenosum]|uniref:Uncharacterized protein n=1 Tax=Mycolicibacterium arenosum TaxID=2952157 RepID=A0ABT1MEC6_9MYCO|nr:hypothetical protein [Mycolicibacterium sp. CAU 1645]MCP9276945.1 hypothetical protein [Mycolicibacterium sp. CAU 1645]
MGDESDEEFTDRVIAAARARHGTAGDGGPYEGGIGEWVRRRLQDPAVWAAMTPAETEQIRVILQGAYERRMRRGE